MTRDITRISHRLRAATVDLHRQAEAHPFISSLMNGSCSAVTYLSYLRNLLPLYKMIEREVAAAKPRHPALLAFNQPGLARAKAIQQDIRELQDFYQLPAPCLLPAGQDFTESSVLRPALMIVAHAYVRYFGDLAGGQVLANCVATAIIKGLEGGTHFYRFAGYQLEADRRVLMGQMKSTLYGSLTSINEVEHLCDEARRAFLWNIALFDQLLDLKGPQATAP